MSGRLEPEYAKCERPLCISRLEGLGHYHSEDATYRIPEPQTQPQRPYQDQLPEGATVVGWNEDFVAWRPQHPTFPKYPYAAHPVRNGKLAGSGTYDMSPAEVRRLTGLVLVAVEL